MNLHASRNTLKRREEEQTKEGNRLTAQTETKEHKHQDQEAEELQYMQSEQQINLHDFNCIHFDSISTVYPRAPKVNIDTMTTMDTATDRKTYILTDLDVKLPTR